MIQGKEVNRVKIRNLVCTAVLAAAMMVSGAGVANAEHTNDIPPNQEMAPGSWYYQYIGPYYSEFGTPDRGVVWQKDFEGQVTYVDPYFIQIKADGSGDKMMFYTYPGQTYYTPSYEGIREGSHLKIRSDARHRVRWVTVVPFYRWLAGQTK